MIKVVSNKEQTATGPLPITFNSDGTPLDDYKLYGTSEGAGVETESGEPAGYKLQLTVTSGAQSQNIPIYIGDSKLGAEEYADYEEQKIYRNIGGVLTPTDPPVPLPELSTYSGENTLGCSEALGDESQITYVGPVEETITKIVRTEDNGQGNVTEHVLYKEGS